MTREDVTAILERVRTWPDERQEDLAQIALQLEQQDQAEYSLTDEQVRQVQHIREQVRAGMIASDDEIAALWKKCGL
jgi:hypothetical protein